MEHASPLTRNAELRLAAAASYEEAAEKQFDFPKMRPRDRLDSELDQTASLQCRASETTQGGRRRTNLCD